MNQRDLLRIKIPGQEFELTDGIYNYILSVHSTQEGRIWYSIVPKGALTRDSINFWPEVHVTQREDFYNHRDYVKYEYTKLRAHATISGMNLHAEDGSYWILQPLKFLPRGKML